MIMLSRLFVFISCFLILSSEEALSVGKFVSATKSAAKTIVSKVANKVVKSGAKKAVSSKVGAEAAEKGAVAAEKAAVKGAEAAESKVAHQAERELAKVVPTEAVSAVKTGAGKKILNVAKSINPFKNVVEAKGLTGKAIATVKGVALAGAVAGGFAIAEEGISSRGNISIAQAAKNGAAATIGNVQRFVETVVKLPGLAVSNKARQDYAIDMAKDKHDLEEKFGVQRVNVKTDNEEVASLALAQIMKEFNIKHEAKPKKPKNPINSIDQKPTAAGP